MTDFTARDVALESQLGCQAHATSVVVSSESPKVELWTRVAHEPRTGRDFEMNDFNPLWFMPVVVSDRKRDRCIIGSRVLRGLVQSVLTLSPDKYTFVYV